MPKKEQGNLWAAFIAGEEKAFYELYSSFFPQLYRYGLRLSSQEEEVKDVIQDTFFYLYEKRDSLADNVSNVRSYLFTTFRRNLVRKNQQKKREQHQLDEQFFQSDQQFIIGVEDILIRKETDNLNKVMLVGFLNDLPPRQREILYLKYYQEHSTSEIAETLSISYQSVSNQLYRALSKLRSNYQAVK